MKKILQILLMAMLVAGACFEARADFDFDFDFPQYKIWWYNQDGRAFEVAKLCNSEGITAQYCDQVHADCATKMDTALVSLLKANCYASTPTAWSCSEAEHAKLETGLAALSQDAQVVASAKCGTAQAFPGPGPKPSVCGNGIPETGEQCEDGNALSGDGCSFDCWLEAKPSGTVQWLAQDVRVLSHKWCGQLAQDDGSDSCNAALLDCEAKVKQSLFAQLNHACSVPIWTAPAGKDYIFYCPEDANSAVSEYGKQIAKSVEPNLIKSCDTAYITPGENAAGNAGQAKEETPTDGDTNTAPSLPEVAINPNAEIGGSGCTLAAAASTADLSWILLLPLALGWLPSRKK